MNQTEAERFVKDISHAMCCIAHRNDGNFYTNEMPTKVLSIRQYAFDE